MNANDEYFFKKIFANFNELFSNNSSVNQLTCNEEISIMKWKLHNLPDALSHYLCN